MNVTINYSMDEIRRQKRLYGLNFVELSEQQLYLYRVGVRLVSTLVAGTVNDTRDVITLLTHNIAHILTATIIITPIEIEEYMNYPLLKGLPDKSDLNDDYISNILHYKTRVRSFVEEHMMSYSLIEFED